MRHLLLAAPLLILACSGTSGTVPPLGSEVIVGSYDIAFQTVTVDKGGFGPQSPASPGTHARLDIRKGAGGYEGVVTSAWEQPAAMQVAVEAGGKVVITGSATVQSGTVRDTWTELDLTIDSTGHLGPAISGVGSTEDNQGDLVANSKFVGTATLGPDTVAPEVKNELVSGGPSTGMLPWDPVILQASEPVDTSAWQGKTALSAGTLVYSPPSKDQTWVGDTVILGYLATWDGAKGQAALSIQGGLTDPSGNQSSPYQTTATFLDVGKKVSGFHFDGTDTTTVGQWGKTKTIQGGVCTSAGCMEIGPTDGTNPCNPGSHGIAGRLDATGKTNLVVHYLIRGNPGQTGVSNPPQGMPAFTVSVATPGAATAASNTPVTTPAMTDTTGDFKWQSAWQTTTFALPAGAIEIGFSVAPFTGYGCGGGPTPIPYSVDLVVDGITLQ